MRRPGGPHVFPKRLQPSRPRPLGQIIKEQERHIAWDRPMAKNPYGSAHWVAHWTLQFGIFTHQQVRKLLDFYIDKKLLPITKAYKVISTNWWGKWNFLWVIELEEPSSSTPVATHKGEDDAVKLPQKFILRIGQPRDPFFKIESEVATMCFARDHGVPAPEVYYFDSSAVNPLGVEFIIMEIVDGKSSHDWEWDGAGPGEDYSTFKERKREALKQLDHYLKRLEEIPFDAIGSIYYDWAGDAGYFIGPMVDYHLTAEPWASVHGVNRGPFPDMKSFLEATLHMWEREATDDRLLFDPGTAKDNAPVRPADGSLTTDPRAVICTKHTEERNWYQREHFDTMKRRVDLMRNKLFPLLDKHMPWILDPASGANDGPEDLLTPPSPTPSMTPRSFLQPHIFHHDLHLGNMMVDPPTGTIVAIIDWEGTIALPGPARLPITLATDEMGHDLGWDASSSTSLFWLPKRRGYGGAEMLRMDGKAAGDTDAAHSSTYIDKRFRPCNGAVTGRAMALREVIHLVRQLPRWEDDDEKSFAGMVEVLEEMEAAGTCRG